MSVRARLISAFVLGGLAALAARAAAAADTPLTLDEALRIARAHNPAIEAQRGQVLAAGGRQQQALSLLLPFVNASFAYAPTTPNLVVTPAFGRQLINTSGQVTVLDSTGAPVLVDCRTPGFGNCRATGKAPNVWALQPFWTADFGVSWIFWDWGRSLYNYRGSRDLAASADVGVHTAERDVALAVKAAFFTAIAADEEVAVAEDATRTYGAHLAQTRSFHDAGLRTGIDVATAESALASVAITLARAQAAQQTARAQLVLALGEDRWRDWKLVVDPAAFDLQAPGDPPPAAAPDDLAELAFRQRPEIRQLALQESGQLSSVRSARGSYFPQLSLSLGPSFAGTDFAALASNFTITVGIGYPLTGMSPVLVRGQTREAEGNLVATRAQVRSTRESIRQETVDARALLVSARDELVQARALVEAAARQRALAEGRYTTGVGNIIELYDALLTDVNARFQMVQARVDLATARARVQHALGTTD